MSGLGTPLINAVVHDAQAMRRAGRDLLSLALMDARNRTLGWLAAFDGLQWAGSFDAFDPPWWLAGQAGWYQEHWIARFVQRRRGERADPLLPRLPSIEARADAWFSPRCSTRLQRWQCEPPDAASLQAYLSATLDSTLELLDKTPEDDDQLLVFRQALRHEDRMGEALAVLVQAFDLAPERHQLLLERGMWPTQVSRGRRDAMWLPGQTLDLGSPPGGAVPSAERWAHPVQVPEFEIDAQPVSWAEYVEFVSDGAYDQARWWTDAGWQMLEATGRRAPRYVEQTGGGVLARRQGRLQRLPLAQAVLHVSAHEAQAWCAWAGRRLPTEAEWLLAASSASARGFVWGELLEWVAGSARAWPQAMPAGPPQLGLGARAAAAARAPGDWPGPGLRVLRGASAWGSSRLRHLQARRYAPADADELFVGFRSCAA